MDTIVYKIDKNLYINLTNRCSNNCVFCVRGADSYEGYKLWLKKEPTAGEVIAELQKQLTPDIAEVVFCGFGEPLYRLEVLLEVATWLKKAGYKTRLNTNGQADLIVGAGVADRLEGLIDTVSISLNAPTASGYQKVSRSQFGEDAFASLLRFAEELSGKATVVFSVIDTLPKAQITKSRKLAREVGATLRVRPLIT